MWRWWPLLPVDNPDGIVSLGEGGTPLLPSRVLRATSFKDESRNPTGSHKDRPLAVAMTHARALGREVAVVVSAGSTGIANAAMAARAGMRSVAFVPRGTPAERLYPVYALGSTVVVVDDEVDPIVDRLAAMAQDGDVYVSSTARSSNPYQAEGTKTIAYELAEQGGVPDWVVVPVGGGGTVAGIWRGFRDLQRLGWIDRVPRLLGVVARDYNALEVAFERGLDDPRDA